MRPWAEKPMRPKTKLPTKEPSTPTMMFFSRLPFTSISLPAAQPQIGELYIENTAGCPVYIVAGNNDFFADLPGEEEICIGERKILMTHGHGYYVSRNTNRLKKAAIERGVHIAMYGHTHIPEIDMNDDVIVLNPGSLSYPRQAGHRGSYIIIHIDQENVKFELKYV